MAPGSPSPPSCHACSLIARRAEEAGIAGTTRLSDNTAVLTCAREADTTDIAGIVGTTLLTVSAAGLTCVVYTHRAGRWLAVVVGTTGTADKTAVLARSFETHRAQAAASGVTGTRSIGETDLSGPAAGISLLAGIGLADPRGAVAAVADRTKATIDRLLAVVRDGFAFACAGGSK